MSKKIYISHGSGKNNLDLKFIGSNVVIEDGVRIFNSSNISIKKGTYVGHDSLLNGYNELCIGENCWIGPQVYMHSAGRIYIGDNVGIAAGVKLLTSYHDITPDPYPIKDANINFEEIKIGSGCDLGVNSVILPGTVLGKNVQVGAGSVVKGTFPNNVVIVGVPAKILRKIEPNTSIEPVTKVKYFDYKEVILDRIPEITNKITDILNNDRVIMGKEVSILENNINNFTNSEYCLGCSSGTDALIVLLLSLELKKKEVIVPTFTFAATVEAICLAGLTPVMVDIGKVEYMEQGSLIVEENNYHTNLSIIKNAITKNTGAIIFVHLFGRLIDISDINTFSKSNGLYLIEDCAQAFGSTNSSDNFPGSQSDGAIFSFFPCKTLGAAGDAGAIVTNNKEIYDKSKAIRNHGSYTKYRHDILGGNFRISTIQAGILNILLNDFQKRFKKRKNNFELYIKLLKKNKKIVLPKEIIKNSGNTIAIFSFTCERRNELHNYLFNDRNIECYKYWPEPLHIQPAFAKYVKEEQTFENSEKICEKVLALPIYSKLKRKEIEYICNSINYFYNKL
jgi:dTDP-4-amino-4,6-dideoxygalactose transaminase/acetyltransferase-like isoleucine patch superfamily enzyme